MTYETAFILFADMPREKKRAVLAVYVEISAAFPNVREAFVQAVSDECRVAETEMMLLQKPGEVMQ